jgi:rubrerythrin
MKTIVVDDNEEKLLRRFFEPFSKMVPGFYPEADAARNIIEELDAKVAFATGNPEEAPPEQAFRASVDILKEDLPPARMMEIIEEICGVSAPRRPPAAPPRAVAWRCAECEATGAAPTPTFCPTCKSPEISNEIVEATS